MKNLTVKKKLLFYLCSLMIILTISLLSFTLMISKRVVKDSTIQQISEVIKENASYLHEINQQLIIDDQFQYSINGINTLKWKEVKTAIQEKKQLDE